MTNQGANIQPYGTAYIDRRSILLLCGRSPNRTPPTSREVVQAQDACIYMDQHIFKYDQ
nr:hypothetical protein [uncultured Allomuricauda sp.]